MPNGLIGEGCFEIGEFAELQVNSKDGALLEIRFY